ncbi:hypothetical protein AGMMS4952_25530 [Spirochaetia bacterium]|nr:hypothetical protein AGMMS4952_25530 [Spirochaetia bacterium]
MKPLTEQDIRQKLKKMGELKVLTIYKDTLVTPSAAELIKMKQISLVYSDEEEAAGEKAQKILWSNPLE